MWSRCEPRAPARACSAREWRRLSRLRDLNVAGRGGRCQSPIGGDESTRARRRARRTGRPARGCARKVRRRAAGEQRWEGRVVAAARSPRRASRGRCAGLDLARADEPGQCGEHLRRLVRRGADVLAGDLLKNPLRSRLSSTASTSAEASSTITRRTPLVRSTGAKPCRWRRRDAVGGTGPALPIPAGQSSAVRVRRLPERARTAATAASWLPGTAHPGGRRSPWACPHGIPMPIHASLLSWR